jgi:hypothetical protein
VSSEERVIPEWRKPTDAQLRSRRTVLRVQYLADRLRDDLKDAGLSDLDAVLFVQRYWKDENNSTKRRYIANCCATYRFTNEHLEEIKRSLDGTEGDSSKLPQGSLEALFSCSSKSFTEFSDSIKNVDLDSYDVKNPPIDIQKAHDSLIESISSIPYSGELPSAFDASLAAAPFLFFRQKTDNEQGDSQVKFEWRANEGSYADLTTEIAEFVVTMLTIPQSKGLQKAFDNFLKAFMIGEREEASSFQGIAVPCYEKWTKRGFDGAFHGWVILKFTTNPETMKTDEVSSLRLLVNHFAERVMDANLVEVIGEYATACQTSGIAKNPEEAIKDYIPRIDGWNVTEDAEDSALPLKLFRTNGDGELEVYIEKKYDTILATDRSAPPDALVVRSQRLFRALEAFYSASRADEYQNQAQTLEKQAQMLNLLEEPLRGVSEAIIQIQSESQRLRSILYDPARSLFDAHEQLIGLFDEGKLIRVSKHVSVLAAHKTCCYTETGGDFDNDDASPEKRKGSIIDGKVVLATAIMGILGRKLDLADAQSRRTVVHLARECLRRVSKDKAFKELLEDLGYLFFRDSRLKSPDELRQLMTTIFDLSPAEYLKQIKRTLFDPFKFQDTNWEKDALLLAVKRYFLKSGLSGAFVPTKFSNISEEFTSDFNIPNPFPVSCHSILALLMEAAAEAFHRSRSNPVTTISLQNCGSKFENPWVISLGFSADYSEDSDSHRSGRVELRKLINAHVLSCPRDWRLSSSYAGNFRKPFLDFAGKILGIGSGWLPVPVSQLCGSRSCLELFRIRSSDQDASFSVLIGKPGVTVIWWKKDIACPVKDFY